MYIFWLIIWPRWTDPWWRRQFGVDDESRSQLEREEYDGNGTQ